MSVRSIVGKLLGSFYWRQIAAARCCVRRGGKSIKKIVMICRCFVGSQKSRRTELKASRSTESGVVANLTKGNESVDTEKQ
jgi:hypothetical protein